MTETEINDCVEALRAKLKGEPWQRNHPLHNNGEWQLGHGGCGLSTETGWRYRPTPFDLRNLPGFRPLTDSEQWHRPDFTSKDLEGGWRPLLKGEKPVTGHSNDEFRLHSPYGIWSWQVGDSLTPAEDYNERGFWRTKRPLPPLAKTRDLCLSDIAGKSVSFQSPEGNPYWPICANRQRVYFHDGVDFERTYEQLHAQGWKVSINGATWQPCEMEVK